MAGIAGAGDDRQVGYCARSFLTSAGPSNRLIHGQDHGAGIVQRRAGISAHRHRGIAEQPPDSRLARPAFDDESASESMAT
jgi:hypothetical protein